MHAVTIGFGGDADLEAGKVAAFTGYWPDDGVTVAQSGQPVEDFKLNQWGGPDYPGLVAFTTRKLIGADPGLVRAFVAATVHGYEDTLRDPQRSLADLLHANSAIEPRLARASLRAPTCRSSTRAACPYGTLVPASWPRSSRWLAAHRLIARALRRGRFGTNRFLSLDRL